MSYLDTYKKRVKSTLTDSQFAQSEISQSIKDEFYSQPNYYQVYKNGVAGTLFDVIIGEGDKDDKANGFKKLLAYPADAPQFSSGDLIYWTYGGIATVWILTTIDSQYSYGVSGRIILCNNTLKYILNGALVTQYCVVNDSLNSRFTSNQYIDIQQGQVLVTVPYSANILTIQKFVLNGEAYKVVRHSNLNDSNILSLVMELSQSAEDDDLVNDIANTDTDNYGDVVIGTNGNVISPAVTSIKQGEEITFTCYNYVNSVASAKTFTFAASGVIDTSCYTLTTVSGNSFKVKNNKYNISQRLVITATCSDASTATLIVSLTLV